LVHPQGQTINLPIRTYESELTSVKGDGIKEAEPIETQWRKERRVAEGQFDSIRIKVYELDTPSGTEAPLYFNRREYKMVLEARPPLNRQLAPLESECLRVLFSRVVLTKVVFSHSDNILYLRHEDSRFSQT
jgi:hypothetical protein